MLLPITTTRLALSHFGFLGMSNTLLTQLRGGKPCQKMGDTVLLSTQRLSSSGTSSPVSSQDTIVDTSPNLTSPVVPKTSREKLKAAIRDYGKTVLVFHIASGVTLLSMWYLIISTGVDVNSLLKNLGLEATLGRFAEGASTFVVAYAIHKATAPLRIGLTIAASPLIVRFLRAKGLMKVRP